MYIHIHDVASTRTMEFMDDEMYFIYYKAIPSGFNHQAVDQFTPQSLQNQLLTFP